MPNQPTNPSRHNFFSRLGAILKGVFAHGRVVDPEALPVVAVGDITELTVDENSRLRVEPGIVHVIVDGGSTPVLSTWDCTAAEQVADTVYNLAGVARRGNAGAVATMPSIGFILSKPDATHCVVVSAGDLVGVLAGLVPGAWYYAGIVNGTITTTVPTLGGGFAVLQALGYAKTATDFVVDRQPQIVL